MTNLRILFVTNMYPSAALPASGIFVEQQIEGLRRAGVRTDVLFLDRRNEGRRAYAGLRGRLSRALEANPADLVHVMYGGVMAERATRAAGDIPVVVTFHGSDLQGSLGSGPVDRLSAAYGVWCSRQAAQRASGVVVVAPHLALRLPNVQADRVRVIPCGIDLDRFRPLDSVACRKALGWSPEGFHVLFATNNGDPVKRPELAREAVERLAAAGVPAELHVLRSVPNEDVSTWLNASDVLLLTSYQEGSPTIVKEAMACERPIVSVPVGDVAAQLEGIAGCHLAPADPGALAEALGRVLAGPRRTDARARAEAQSLEATARRLVDFYESVLASRIPGVASSAARPSAQSAAGAPSSLPAVTVVMPVRNEEDFIRRSLGAVLAQDYPSDRLEIIVADGRSTDGTARIVASLQASHPNLQLIENPGRVVATGLNLALSRARGDVLVRVDGHCEIASDYVRRSVEHLTRDGVDGVGGPLETVGEGRVAEAIALAMSSRFGVGGSPFRTLRGVTRLVDSIAFPAYWRHAVEKAGPFDEELVRNQDDEYNYRLRKGGAKLLLAADVRCRYYSRGNFRSLWRQYFQYGYWKVRVLQKHPRQMRARQFAPLALVAALLFGLASSPFSVWGRIGLGAVAASYALALAGAAFSTDRRDRLRVRRPSLAPMLALAFATLHLAYGSGFAVGLVRFWNRWGNSGNAGSGASPRIATAVEDSSAV